ncbi:MAG: PAS domain-containing sensor histidine kinase, partial [Ignavibacteria bacterium]|nr:PAS domain-containing sensor histidine kinase [Ignavibacteria bacterium]
LVAQNSSELINISSLDGTMTFLNEAGSRMLGISTQDVERHNIMEVIPDHLKGLVQNELLPDLMEKGHWEGNLQYRNIETGVLTDVHAMCFAIRNEKTGAPLFLANVSLDITERKRAENQLRKLSQAVEQSPASVVITNPDGYIEYVNPKFIEITGYTLEEAVGQNPRILKSGVHTVALYKELWDTISSGKEWKGELCNKKKNGELYWESELIFPIKNERGEILHFMALKEDITERRSAEQKIQESERFLSTLFDAVGDAIFTISMPERKIVQVNKAVTEIFGYIPEEIIGKQTNILYPSEEEFLDYGKKINDAITNAKHSIKAEVRLVKKDGTKIWCDLHTTFIKRNDSVIYYITVVKDITERKKIFEELIAAKEKAEEANRLKSGFLSAMSHEIRTPLNAIIGFNGIIRELFEESGNPEHEQYFEAVEKGSLRLLNTITQILDISRIEANEFIIELISISMNAVIKSVCQQLNILAEKKNLEMELLLPTSDVLVIADYYCLNGALINIIGNAIKYSEKGKIEIKLTKDNKFAVCSVKDEGIGMSEKYQRHLYQPFSQEVIGISRPFEGTGLGLALTKSYIDYMNGKISVESQKGIGTTVTIKIPLDN